MKPVDAIREIRDEMIADAKVKADAMAKAAVRAEAEAMYKLAKNGMKRDEIAALFECGVATVHRRIRLHTEENNIARRADGRLHKAHKEKPEESVVEAEKEVAVEEPKEEILLLPAPVAEAQEFPPKAPEEYKGVNKAIIAKGWKERKEYGEHKGKRDYREWCKEHEDQHEALNYFRLLNKRGARINLKEKIGTLRQMKLIREFPEEEMNIKKYAPKFNIRFRFN